MAFFDALKKGVGAVLGQKQPQETKQDKGTFYSVLNLHLSDSTGDLLDAHRQVQNYYMPWNTLREYYHDFQHPESHWTDDERAILAKKHKAAIAFSKMKSAERTYLGSIIQNKYDIKPSPVNPDDQSFADVYTALYNSTAFQNQTRIRDIDVLRESWIGGNAWQESYVEQYPGKTPVIIVKNQNNFAIYPDPNRRDLVTNYDCRFIDRVGWYLPDDLCAAYPEKAEEIQASLQSQNQITYLLDKPYADRQHEFFETKNGRYKVVERFYKVYKRQYFSVDNKGNRQDLGYDLTQDEQADFKLKDPTITIYNCPEEFLFLAVACTSMGGYLYNGPYHQQPKDPVTGKIMFTLLELIDEDVGGVPSGHVEHMVGPNKVIDSMMVNLLAQAKNASGVARVGNPDAFDEAAQIDISKNISDGDRVFWKKRGAAVEGTGLDLVPQGTMTADTQTGVNFAAANLDDVSSTPPSMKGFSEGNVPGVLNEQRIQQAFTQSQVQVTNYMNFLTQRAKLWMYYWNSCFTAQQTIANIDKLNPTDPDTITINKLVIDQWGQPKRINNLQDADAHQIVFEDSWQSPTNKDKIRKQVTEFAQTAGVANDPILTMMLASYFLQSSDVPSSLKTSATSYLDNKVKQAQNPPPPPPPPKQPPDPIRVSLALQGADLHDPEVLAMLEYSNAIPAGAAQQMSTGPGAQIKQSGDIADVQKKHLNNHLAFKQLEAPQEVGGHTSRTQKKPEMSPA